MQYILTVDGIKEAFAEGKVMNCIQNIGFPLAIVACQAIQVMTELQYRLRIVFKIN